MNRGSSIGDLCFIFLAEVRRLYGNVCMHIYLYLSGVVGSSVLAANVRVEFAVLHRLGI